MELACQEMDTDQDKNHICHFYDLVREQNSEGKEDGIFPSLRAFELSVAFSLLALLMTDKLEVVILYR